MTESSNINSVSTGITTNPVRVKPARQQNGDDELDVGYLLAICLDSRWLIIFISALITLAGAGYAWLTEPIYRGDALLQVEQQSGNLAGMDAVLRVQEQTGSTTQSEILRSRMIMGRAAQQAGLDLVVRPQYFPVIGESLVRRGKERPGWEEGSVYAWAGDNIDVAELRLEQAMQGRQLTLQVTGPDSYTLFDANHQTLGDGRVDRLFSSNSPYIELLVSRIQAPLNVRFSLLKRNETQMTRNLQGRFNVSQRGGDTGILELSLTGPDRQELQRSLDAIANVYLVQNINRQAAEAEARLEFIEQQTPQILDSLNSAENRLNEYRASQDSIDLNFETRTMLERMVQLESELNSQVIQESEIAQRFTPSHPNYQALLNKRAQLQNERDRLEVEVNNLPETQQQVLRLNRDVQVSQQIYMQMLNATQELRIARAGTVGNVRILDTALVGASPIAPRSNLIIGISMIVGLMLGLVIVLVRHLLHRGITSVEELQTLGLQVYATIPLSQRQVTIFGRVPEAKNQRLLHALLGKKLANRISPLHRRQRVKAKGVGVLALIDPGDLAIEALRSLRTSLHFAMLEARNNRLMLTSPSPGAGKSFISGNLAVICAQGGQKVLLIDCDLRKGHLNRFFGSNSKQGLSDYLVGDISKEDLIHHSDQQGLDYITRGTSPPNPSELLMTRRFNEFLEEVGNQYDLVIIDTPPVLAVTDGAVVGKQAGTTLLITRFRENNLNETERSLQQLEIGGVMVNGTILNAIEPNALTYYGYGYYHYKYQSNQN